jgi:nucleotide-binding universal stress UspA family protein
MLVRARPSETDRGEAPFQVGRLVVPLDGSDLAERALPVAADMAERFGAVLSLLRVLPPAAPRVAIPLDPTEQEQTKLKEARVHAERYLESVAAPLRSRGSSVALRVIENEHPAPAIIEHAAADVVVMCTHARTAPRALLGSVTDKVVRGSRGFVLAIPEDNAGAVTTGRPPPGGVPAAAPGKNAIATLRRRVV